MDVTPDDRKGRFPALYDELFALRKAERPTSSLSFSKTPELVRALGSGNPRNEFVHVCKTLALSDRDVAAYTLSILGKGSVLDRLVKASEHMHIDERQVRRLGDAGIRKLADFIGNLDIKYRPLAYIGFFGSDRVGCQMRVDFHSLINPAPSGFYLNGEPIALVVERFEVGEEYVPQYRLEPPLLKHGDVFVMERSNVGTYKLHNQYLFEDVVTDVTLTPTGGVRVEMVDRLR